MSVKMKKKKLVRHTHLSSLFMVTALGWFVLDSGSRLDD